MLAARRFLLMASIVMVLLLLGGGLVLRVGAGEKHAFRQVGLFTEVLDLVLDNYVDPVETRPLLGGAYEGLLGGLDANGAYLTPTELAEWKQALPETLGDPGVHVLKAGSALQVVAVDPGSSAEASGIAVGDHLRSVDGKPIRDLSLAQAWRLLQGPPGSTVAVDLLRVAEDYRHEKKELVRALRRGRTFSVDVERGTAVVRFFDLPRVDPAEVKRELAEVRSRGVERMLLDLRALAEPRTRTVARVAGLFTSGALLQLRDRAGHVLEAIETSGEGTAWPGSIDVLVNGATAGAAEALALVIKSRREGLVLGEETYGLGAESRLFELESGAGLLLSHARWETPAGTIWNGDGIKPDEAVHGRGKTYQEVAADQLARALEIVEQRHQPVKTSERKAA